MIPFNKPAVTGNEVKYIQQAIESNVLCGDGPFTKRCEQWFVDKLLTKKALLTPSCTHALELAALLIDIRPGDEVIMPSYTFVSTANAFVLHGAKIVFVDIRPDTMNIDETLIEDAITEKTKAIVPVHYAGVACEMDTIMSIASKHNLYVIEDAAQGMMSTYRGKFLGTIGHIGTFSFHETKNYTSGGEGGVLLLNEEKFIEQAEVHREKGTNRSKFFRGMVDKYSWVEKGSSMLPSEIQAAYLWSQLENASKINKKRLSDWASYDNYFNSLKTKLPIETPKCPEECVHNGHMYYLKFESLDIRTKFIQKMKLAGVLTPFHYVPLHSAPAGKRFGRFNGKDTYTTSHSECLVRLPMFYSLTDQEHSTICGTASKIIKEILCD
ncbi:dTDP-4-amino-4,6-dideoxygalactose transaminase [Vibrio hangzhouensis]|uniref:dTDP-4-amino-4,6-dideoxygalactose transaminase n=1 Tax=Vibrio hangzhouensis TaxID=462991 RepID=A0A1H6CA09_9VIBR|nr:dTDP-4-amino-4,6-dideoxygalactose transaminase [Vibrio hangzhouensis]SEG69814.1 dTDP-4-amino-4,6-dideoxygalactose transaminase [Vibrio hangzhouensis]